MSQADQKPRDIADSVYTFDEQELLLLSIKKMGDEQDHEGHKYAADFRIGFRYGYRMGHEAVSDLLVPALEQAQAERENIRSHLLSECKNHKETQEENAKLKAQLSEAVKAGNKLKEKLMSFCGCSYDEQCDVHFEIDEFDATIKKLRGEG